MIGAATLRELREARGLTQREVAEAAGRRESWVYDHERRPIEAVNVLTLREFCEACGYDVTLSPALQARLEEDS